MTDLKRHVEDEHGIPKEGGNGTPQEHGKQHGRSKTAGTNRDFDADSDNLGHGHPREERNVSDNPLRPGSDT